MSKQHKRRLVLAGMQLASAVIRLAVKLLDLWDMTSNYRVRPYASQVDFAFRN